MKKITFLFCLLCFGMMNSQFKYALDTVDKEKREAFIKNFEISNENFITSVTKEYQGKTAKILRKNLQEFKKDFTTEIKERNFLFDPKFLDKATKILDHFKETNPSIPKDTKILISKNPSLNAYCLPDGTFVVNMGLFYWLDNEDQLAGVLAHEISHKLLKHSISGQIKVIEDQLSEQTKEQINEIKNQKYKKSEKAFELYKSKLYARGKDRQKQEYEADSLGYLLLRNTKYNKLDYIETMRMMEKYDTLKPPPLKKELYKQLYDLSSQPFKEEWLKVEDFSGYDYSLYKEKLNKDSLSTHPETVDRIKKLQKLFPELNTPTTNQPTEEYKELEKTADYNIVPVLMFFEEYGSAIYYCMNKLQKDLSEEDKAYYKKMLGENFEKIYQARKEYKLNRYLDRIEPKEQSESYIQYLSFMWNLSLEELKNIAAYYK